MPPLKKENAALRAARMSVTPWSTTNDNKDTESTDAQESSKSTPPPTTTASTHDPLVVTFPHRENLFTGDTWWMVDLEHRPKLTQGATPLVARCMRDYGWTLDYTRRVLKGYQQFLKLKQHHQDWNATIVSPSAVIDKMWHAHILDTNNYPHDCLLLTGHFVNHNPDGGDDEEARFQRRKTTKAGLEALGEDVDAAVWAGVVDCEAVHACFQSSSSAPNQAVGTETNSKSDDTITIGVDDYTGRKTGVTFFKIHRTTRLGRVFEVYAEKLGVSDHSNLLRFFLNGKRISGHDTPNMLALGDNDLIDCMAAQTGC